MAKFRVFLGIFVVFLVFLVAADATKPVVPVDHVVVENSRRPQHYKLDYPKQDQWSHFPITRQRIFKELGLSVDQLREIHELRLKHKEDVRILRKQHKESVMNVLTPGQKDTLDIKLEELKRIRGRHDRPAGPNRPLRQRDCKCNDFLKRSTDDFRSMMERANQTNIEPTTWGKIKNLFE